MLQAGAGAGVCPLQRVPAAGAQGARTGGPLRRASSDSNLRWLGLPDACITPPGAARHSFQTCGFATLLWQGPGVPPAYPMPSPRLVLQVALRLQTRSGFKRFLVESSIAPQPWPGSTGACTRYGTWHHQYWLGGALLPARGQ